MRATYAGAVLAVIYAAYTGPRDPSLIWVFFGLFVLLESACWREAFRARGVTVKEANQ